MTKNLRVTPGAVLALTAIAALSGPKMAVLALTAAAVHELGHIVAIKIFGAKVEGICIAPGGAEIDVRGGLGYRQDAAVALMGPAAGGALALLCSLAAERVAGQWRETLIALGSISALYSLFNLLPMGPMDGGRAFSDVCGAILGPSWAYILSTAMNIVCGAALAAGGVYIFVRSRGNVTALLCAGTMIKACCKTAGFGVKSHNRKV